MADLVYNVLVFLLENPKIYHLLTKEIREHSLNYKEIISQKTLTSLISVSCIHTFIEEVLPMLLCNNIALPKISPEAIVNMRYIYKVVSINLTALISSYVFSYYCSISAWKCLVQS